VGSGLGAPTPASQITEHGPDSDPSINATFARGPKLPEAKLPEGREEERLWTGDLDLIASEFRYSIQPQDSARGIYLASGQQAAGSLIPEEL
jgi:hypothetical protein